MGLRIYEEERTQIPPSSSPKIDKVYNNIYTDIKIASNTKIIHIMVSFTDHYNDSPQKLKLEKIHETLIMLFYVSPARGLLS